MILLDATVNSKPAVLVLDTGAMQTIISDKSGPSVKMLGQRAPDASVQLRLGQDFGMALQAFGMNLEYAQKQLGAKFDGILGEDVLRDFSAVRVDFKAGVVEFEK